jgi:hypothetical protein
MAGWTGAYFPKKEIPYWANGWPDGRMDGLTGAYFPKRKFEIKGEDGGVTGWTGA